MPGFGTSKQRKRSSSYWIATYTKDNEDEPQDIKKKVLSYVPGQDKDSLMIKYCHRIMNQDQSIWEILVHQGPSEVPDSGDQITLRLSREKFDGATQIN